MRTFKPNCSLPLESAAFVSAPNVRGTLGIVWPCISTILLCTWSIQHLNVPEPRIPKTWPQWFGRKFYTVGRKIVWMIVALMAPEYLVGVAFSELIAVSTAEKHVKKFADEDGVEWTTAHTYLANMGGFVLVLGQPGVGIKQGVEAPPVADNRHSGWIASEGLKVDKHGYLLLDRLLDGTAGQPAAVDDATDLLTHPRHGMKALWEQWQASRGGESLWKPYPHNQMIVDFLLKSTWRSAWLHREWYPDLMSLSGNLWVLNANQIIIARSCGILKRMPDVSLEDIKDKSKGEPVAKTIAVAQVLWTIVQLVLRWKHPKRSLPSTQLEIVTLAIAGSSLFTALLFWSKPQGIEAPIYLSADSDPSVEQLLVFGGKRTSNLFTFTWSQQLGFWLPENASWHPHVPGTNHGKLGQRKWRLMATGVGAAVFGSLHFFSWNLDFPSWQERLAWRICLGLTTGLPLYTVLVFYLYALLDDSDNWLDRATEGKKGYQIMRRLIGALNAVLAGIYGLARLFIMVEVVRTLAFQPPDTFVATFAAELPAYG